MKKILVLCTGNSCRSVMGEALINHLGADQFQAFSAGSHPMGHIHPQALETLRRHGVPVGSPKSQSWDEYQNIDFDYIITVCDNAANTPCPVYLGKGQKLHWPIEDPSHVIGNQDIVNKAFDKAFFKLKAHIETELL